MNRFSEVPGSSQNLGFGVDELFEKTNYVSRSSHIKTWKVYFHFNCQLTNPRSL